MFQSTIVFPGSDSPDYDIDFEIEGGKLNTWIKGVGVELSVTETKQLHEWLTLMLELTDESPTK